MIDTLSKSEEIERGFRFAEKIRSLDERSALKIALALAGHDKELFLMLHDLSCKQNMVPPSTLKLEPPKSIKEQNIKDQK